MENSFIDQENQLRSVVWTLFVCVCELSCPRSKYGNLEKRAGTSLLRKRLQPNGRKYFDSGDYNMQKEAVKPNEKPSIRTIPGSHIYSVLQCSKLKIRATNWRASAGPNSRQDSSANWSTYETTTTQEYRLAPVTLLNLISKSKSHSNFPVTSLT